MLIIRITLSHTPKQIYNEKIAKVNVFNKDSNAITFTQKAPEPGYVQPVYILTIFALLPKTQQIGAGVDLAAQADRTKLIGITRGTQCLLIHTL